MGKQIVIVGLGSGTEEDLTLGVHKKLITAKHLFVRTKDHPVVAYLQNQNIEMTFFDSIYEQSEEFEAVYDNISNRLIELAQQDDIIYAVPGHPTVAEKSVKLLIEKASKENINIDILNGPSFLDQCFTSLNIDPIEGFLMLDALSFHERMLNTQVHTVFCQIYDQYVASDVKLTLMEIYPDDYEVTVGISLGIAGEEKILRVPLYEIDRITGYNNLTMLYVPPMAEESSSRSFNRLVEIIETLRGPNGCPWDQKQTHESLKPYLLEEAYELIDEIDKGDESGMVGELGDVLLQVVLHAQIGKDDGFFSIYDVLQHINEKLIRRHPHVFGDAEAYTPEDVSAQWQRIKQEEKVKDGYQVETSVLSGIPNAMPALQKALKLQKKAAKVGFDWNDVEDVFNKVLEEWEELKKAETPDEQQDELGDLLFAATNVARFLHIDPETALSSTNRKFIDRFEFMECELLKDGKKMGSVDLEQMDKLWNMAKNQTKNKKK